MERLLDMAKKVCDQVEVYALDTTDENVDLQNGNLTNIESKFLSGVGLRIIKNGKLGQAYTRGEINQADLLDNALHSLKGGVTADFDFPLTSMVPELNTYSDTVENLRTSMMAEESKQVHEFLQSRTKAEVSIYTCKKIQRIRLVNSAGTNLSQALTWYNLEYNLTYPGTATAITREFKSKCFGQVSDHDVEEVCQLFDATLKTVQPKGGRMQVLFMPNSMITFYLRFMNGVKGDAILKKLSPLADQLGKQIFSEKLTIWDHPLDDQYPGARAFDDEGVENRRVSLVEQGVLKEFCYNIDSAAKANTRSSANGYRTTVWWGDDPITLNPIPALTHLRIQPGEKSLVEIIRSMKQGIILENVMGFHSGNIMNGDFSVGVNPGYYVENGEIVGRVTDAMVAGNIYHTFKQVSEVSNTLMPAFGPPAVQGWVPAILCEDVNVAMNTD